MPTTDKSHCYTQQQENAIKNLGQWKPPEHYVHVNPSVAAQYLAKMSTDPKVLDTHKRDAIVCMSEYGLSSENMQLIKNSRAYIAAVNM